MWIRRRATSWGSWLMRFRDVLIESSSGTSRPICRNPVGWPDSPFGRRKRRLPLLIQRLLAAIQLPRSRRHSRNFTLALLCMDEASQNGLRPIIHSATDRFLSLMGAACFLWKVWKDRSRSLTGTPARRSARPAWWVRHGHASPSTASRPCFYHDKFHPDVQNLVIDSTSYSLDESGFPSGLLIDWQIISRALRPSLPGRKVGGIDSRKRNPGSRMTMHRRCCHEKPCQTTRCNFCYLADSNGDRSRRIRPAIYSRYSPLRLHRQPPGSSSWVLQDRTPNGSV